MQHNRVRCRRQNAEKEGIGFTSNLLVEVWNFICDSYVLNL